MLDGEICCLDPDGRPHFQKLLFRRELPHFYAFDVLSIEAEDLTGLPLLGRKRRLFRVMPRIETRLLYLDNLHERGVELFPGRGQAGSRGYRGKVGEGHVRTDGRATSWLKIKNPNYSQAEDRHELFERRRSKYERRGRRATGIPLGARDHSATAHLKRCGVLAPEDIAALSLLTSELTLLGHRDAAHSPVNRWHSADTTIGGLLWFDAETTPHIEVIAPRFIENTLKRAFLRGLTPVTNLKRRSPV